MELGMLFCLIWTKKTINLGAYGLKKAGYATNPQYPELLIAFIEKHQLHKYDEIKLSDEEDKEMKEDKAQVVKSYGQEIIINEVPAITANANESIAQIALNYDIKSMATV
jgi:hypothetical protein